MRAKCGLSLEKQHLPVKMGPVIYLKPDQDELAVYLIGGKDRQCDCNQFKINYNDITSIWFSFYLSYGYIYLPIDKTQLARLIR